MHQVLCDETAGNDPLTIVFVIDTIGNKGNGTSNSALQYARELERQGHIVRFVGAGAPRYSARVHRIPLISRLAAKQQMQFAAPNDELFRKAFEGADVVHIYMPFKFGRRALAVARSMGLPVTAGFHLQPENVTYSAGPLRYVPGLPTALYHLFDFWLYRDIGHIHAPSRMIAAQLRAHGYRAKLHVISNGYSERYHPVAETRDGLLEIGGSHAVGSLHAAGGSSGARSSCIADGSCGSDGLHAAEDYDACAGTGNGVRQSDSCETGRPVMADVVPSAMDDSCAQGDAVSPPWRVSSRLPRVRTEAANQTRSRAQHIRTLFPRVRTEAASPVGETNSADSVRRPFRIVASGRLSHEKDHETLIRAVAQSRHAAQIDLTICGTGPLKRYLNRLARRLLPNPTHVHIGFHPNDDMPNLLRQADLLVHPSIVDIESLSVLEGIASGLVPVIARSPLSAASQFALTDESVFPARDASALASRIDWWIEHPDERREWSQKYADEARGKYSIETCVRSFVKMEREAIDDVRSSKTR